MKAPHSLHMGPAPAAAPTATATKFWNVASVSEDEGEITLYGDVMSQQPIDWWTGEPEPGLYITPEGFMEDLAAVKDKAHITVKLNSCGGDLYTGIAIHNALKALSGDVNVVVEGIAASAASVIMCAGDTVTVYPGSLIMIHGVSVMLWDSLNIQDMKRLIKGMDASERAVAEIYDGKTGLGVDTLRSMMTKETWMTGREALDKGFAAALKEDEEEPDMSMSSDRKVLYVNGVSHNIEGLHNVPGTIPIQRSAKPAKRPAANKRPTNKAATKTEGGKNHMTLEELRAQEPELVSQIPIAENIRSITYAQDKVGIVTDNVEGGDPYRLRIYDREGSPVFEKTFNYQYTGFDIDGDLVLLYNDSSCKVYNMTGTEKYNGTFDFTVSKVSAGRFPGTLLVMGPQKMTEIKLQ